MKEVDLEVCRARYYEGDGRIAAVLPGAHYLPGYPLLWFAREVLLQQGWGVLEVWDELGDGEDRKAWVAARTRAALEWTSAASDRVLVAKSLSSFAAGLPGTERLPAVWLTPLLNEPEIVAALERREAPGLLVGGTRDDPHWVSSIAARLPNAEVLEIQGADHSLQIEDDVLASVDALRRVVERVAAFISGLEPAGGAARRPPRAHARDH